MQSPPPQTPSSNAVDQDRISELAALSQSQRPLEIISTIDKEPDAIKGQVLARLKPESAITVLNQFPEDQARAIVAAVDFPAGQQWTFNSQYPDDSLGRLMDRVYGEFHPDDKVGPTIEAVRELVKTTIITYGYVTDQQGRLQGVLVMRDLMLADPEQTLKEIMVGNIFCLKPDMAIATAMRAMVYRHYPVYPVCNEDGVLIGSIHGYILFEEYAFELSAQAGSMVGVEKEEHLCTPWLTSLKFRHPWLQLNLLTAFLAAAVVGIFEDTIAQVVLLAVFLPVLAGQSGNTGGQSLAVTLRAMTLGEVKDGTVSATVRKEALLGLVNGALVGITAGVAMYVYALMTSSPAPLALALVVFVAMVGSCAISGVTGVLVPVTLSRLGANPATASTIFLTTSTDVVSMGLFLWLATAIVL